MTHIEPAGAAPSVASSVIRPAVQPPPPPAVVATGLSRRHGAFWALRGVELTLDSGTSTVLFGRNGAGKTTLIRMLATAMRPSGGTLQWFGSADPDRLRIAMLSHQDGHYDDLSAIEHLEMTGALLPARPDRPSPVDLLGRVGLAARADSLVRTFSAGMRKRLAFARLLQKQADLILLDEPYSALDRQGAALVDGLLDEFRAEGRTVLASTHQVERAAAHCERAVQLDSGRVVWVGSAGDAAANAAESG